MYYIVKESYAIFVEFGSYKRKYQPNLDLGVYYLLFGINHHFISMLHFSGPVYKLTCLTINNQGYAPIIVILSFTYMLYFHHIAIRMLLDPS